jgi:predicted transcriptional regulator
MKTDVEKTLRILEEAGEKGIHSFELNYLVGTTRSAARICDLKKLGYTILAKPEVHGGARGVRYILQSSPIFKQDPETKQTQQYEFIGSELVRVFPPQQEVLV